jgi:polysaccharide biosynthesis/export protein
MTYQQLFRISLLFVTLGVAATNAVHAAEPWESDIATMASAAPPAAQPAEQTTDAVSAAVRDAVAPPAGYRVGPEDVLDISVWKEEGLNKEVLVRPDGGITFPLVGQIQAAGKTAEEIGAEIASRLKRAINDPVVSVSVLKVTGNKIYIIGRVARPGEYATGRYVDVLQALAMAGGLTPYAAENSIKVLRKHDGKDEVFEFEYSDVRRGRKLEQNIVLQGGDVVVVP